MTQRITTNTILIFLFGLLILGLAACGSDSTSVVSQTDDATNDTQSVVAVEESHDDEDGHADGLVDEHEEADTHIAAVEDEHDDDEHAVAVDDGHEEAATGSHAHADMTGPIDPDAVVTHISAAEFAYDTTAFEVEAGESFSVQISNTGVLEHDITIEGFESEFGLHVMPGQDNIATYEMHETGEFVYYCTVPGHREAGMTGTLVVAAAHDEADGHHDDEAAGA